MIDLDQLRRETHARIRAAAQVRREVASSKAAASCTHTWQRFVQTVVPDNSKFHGEARFYVIGCPLCKSKRFTGYEVSA